MNRPSDADQYPKLLGKGILIVDEDITNREILREVLVRFGRYDLIVMDVEMPVIDGVEATRCIRKLPRYGDVPILAFTSAGALVREKCLVAGMDDFLPKPCALDELLNAIERWIATYRNTAPRLWFRDPANAGV